MKEYLKPLPEVDADTQPFWDAARRHELVIRRCQNCGAYPSVHYPVSGCPECGGMAMEWVKASGNGNVYTFAVFHMLYHPAFKEEIPYNTAVIELSEGPLMISNIVHCKNDDIRIGMPVNVVFEDISEEITLPKFRPAT